MNHIPNYMVEVQQHPKVQIPFSTYENAHEFLMDIWGSGKASCILFSKDSKDKLNPHTILITQKGYYMNIEQFRNQYPTRNQVRHHSNYAQRQWLKCCIRTIRQYRELGGIL